MWYIAQWNVKNRTDGMLSAKILAYNKTEFSWRFLMEGLSLHLNPFAFWLRGFVQKDRHAK